MGITTAELYEEIRENFADRNNKNPELAKRSRKIVRLAIRELRFRSSKRNAPRQ